MSELIDKQKVVAICNKAIYASFDALTKGMLMGVRDTIAELPSEQPERKRGKWIKARGSWYTPGGDPVWECSECGKGVHIYGIEWRSYGHDVADGQWVSCPNCGAYMGDGQDDTQV